MWLKTIGGLDRVYLNRNLNLNSNWNRNLANSNANGRITQSMAIFTMKTYKKLYQDICSHENLLSAYLKARKHKTKKNYVIEFERDLLDNLKQLKTELLLHSYSPKPLKTFILRDPKTRKISKSHFRDRVIHHALIRIIEPSFEKTFIYDSCANRKNKGTLFTLKRFENFQRKVTKNYSSCGYCLKADIKHYFQEVNHNILLSIIKRKIKDSRTMWLIKQILVNASSGGVSRKRECLLGI